MTATADKTESYQRTGHRPGRDPDEPRNSTICFMVTEREKAVVDAIGYCTNLRRSAILTRIVTTFIEGVAAGEDYDKAKRELVAFLKECRDAFEKRGEVAKGLLGQSKAVRYFSNS